jgi:molecular chaperone DnaJ
MTAPGNDPYLLLKISRDADLAEIKSAYRRLVRRLHPDVCGRSMKNIRRFLDIKDAYIFLLRDRRRCPECIPPSTPPTAPGTPRAREIQNGAFVFIKIDAQQAVLGAEINLEITDREEFCPRCSGLGRYPAKEADACLECSGRGYRIQTWAEKSLKLICSACNGTGTMDLEPCNLCRGKGKIFLQRTIRLEIPRGIMNGTILKLPGQGPWEPDRNSRTPLFVEVEVLLPGDWKIEGNNIISTIEIDCWTHLGGGYITCRTLQGPQRIFISPGSIKGSCLKLKGEGWSDRKGNRGDHIFLIKVSYPSGPCPRSAVRYLQALKQAWPAPDHEKKAITDVGITQEKGIFSDMQK